MLTHMTGMWRTECDRCHAPIEIVGAADKRGKVVELERAGKFLESIGWTRLHRKGAGYRVNWWCPGCVRAVARGPQTSGLALDFDPTGATKKGA